MAVKKKKKRIYDVIRADPRKPGTFCLWRKDGSQRIKCGFRSRGAAEEFEKKLKQIIAIRRKEGDNAARGQFSSLDVTMAVLYNSGD